jgi:hypothetical protein
MFCHLVKAESVIYMDIYLLSTACKARQVTAQNCVIFQIPCDRRLIYCRVVFGSSAAGLIAKFEQTNPYNFRVFS